MPNPFKYIIGCGGALCICTFWQNWEPECQFYGRFWKIPTATASNPPDFSRFAAWTTLNHMEKLHEKERKLWTTCLLNKIGGVLHYYIHFRDKPIGYISSLIGLFNSNASGLMIWCILIDCSIDWFTKEEEQATTIVVALPRKLAFSTHVATSKPSGRSRIH